MADDASEGPEHYEDIEYANEFNWEYEVESDSDEGTQMYTDPRFREFAGWYEPPAFPGHRVALFTENHLRVYPPSMAEIYEFAVDTLPAKDVGTCPE